MSVSHTAPPLSDATNTQHTNTSTKSITTELQRTAHLLSTYNDVSLKYGAKAHRHWKYNYLSAGKDTTLDTVHSEYNTADNTSIHTTFALLDDKQSRVAAGLGYGNKHMHHYAYTAPVPTAQKKLGTLVPEYIPNIDSLDSSKVEEQTKIPRATQVLYSQAGFGRKSAYKFSAFMPR